MINFKLMRIWSASSRRCLFWLRCKEANGENSTWRGNVTSESSGKELTNSCGGDTFIVEDIFFTRFALSMERCEVYVDRSWSETLSRNSCDENRILISRIAGGWQHMGLGSFVHDNNHGADYQHQLCWKQRFLYKQQPIGKKAPGGAENCSGLNFNHKTSARRENSRADGNKQLMWKQLEALK